MASGVTSRSREAGSTGGQDDIDAPTVRPAHEDGADGRRLVGNERTLGDGVALLGGPRCDRVAGAINPFAARALHR